jgi:hypothetical protein
MSKFYFLWRQSLTRRRIPIGLAPCIRIRIRIEAKSRIRIRNETHADPQHWWGMGKRKPKIGPRMAVVYMVS